MIPQKKKCAVIIGVNKTGGLPVLSAAVSGAENFKKWADSQGFDTCLLTDTKDPVTVKMIKDAVGGFVHQKVYDQMIVYYSGHGILKSALDEFWLLSGAPVDSDEAVNVQGSRLFSRKCGIPNVVIISDACRSMPANSQISAVSGSYIFPNIVDNGTQVQLDTLYATRAGDPAYEVAANVAVQNYSGLYTRELLKGLHGRVPQIIQEYNLSVTGPTGLVSQKYFVIPAYELSEYLRQAVPISAGKINVTLSQTPDAEVNSRPPSYLSLFGAPKKALDNSDAAKMTTGKNLDIDLTEFINENKNWEDFDQRDLNKELPEPIKEPREQYSPPPKNYDKEAYDSILQALNRSSKNIRTGFTIVGIPYVKNHYSNKEMHIFAENGAIQIRIRVNLSTYFLDLPGGRLLPLAVLPGFIGTVVFDKGEVITVNYSPSEFSFNSIRGVNEINSDLEERRAIIAAKSKGGTFKISENVDELIHAASYLRTFKSVDPSLGLYAAYAYIQAGKFEDVQSIYDYMRREREPVLFDVAMLNKLSSREPDKQLLHDAAPFCPMLNQGWSYLTINPDFYDPFLIEISKHRVPGLWTTFTDEGSILIRQKFKDLMI
jgi:hypothetical protein